MINSIRGISLLLSVLMLFMFASQVLAYDDSNFLFKEGSLIITSIIESKEYTKIKIENKEDNKIEFVESYLQKDGTYKYIVTTDDDTFTIFKKDENIMIEDKNGNII
ncbi:hypothetical protein [Tepidimicrobium xylanilyticum]